MHRPKRLISIVMMVLMITSMSGSYLSYFEGMGASGSVYAAQNETALDKSAEDQASEPVMQSDSSTDNADKEDAKPADDMTADETAPAERTIKAKVTSEEPYVEDEEGNRKSSEPLKAARRFWNSLTDRIAALKKETSDDAITVEVKGKLPEDIKAEVKHLEFDEAEEYDGYKESAVFAFELILTDGEGNTYVPEEPVEVTLGGKRIEESAKADDHFMLYAYEENSGRAEEYNAKYEEVLKKDNRNSFYAADVLVFDSKYADNDDADKNKSYEVYDSKKAYKDGEDAVRYAEDKSGLSATKKNEIEFSYAYGKSLDGEAEGEAANVDSARFVLSARKLKDAKADEANDEDKSASEEPKVIKAGKITASDGRTYSISVKYGKTASIPEDAELKVEEINEKAKAFDAYMDASAELLESKKKDFTIARAFDITIVDPKTGDVYQPTDEVEVSIRLIDEKIKKDTEISVIHFADPEGVDEKTSDRELAKSISAEQGQVLDNNVRWNGDVEFKTTGFSVFAVIGTDEEPTVDPGPHDPTDPPSYSMKFIFKYVDESNEVKDYMFPNDVGVMVNYQYVPNGEAPYSPGTPGDPILNQQGFGFMGWYGKRTYQGVDIWDEEPTIDPNGVGKKVEGLTVFNRTKELYPRFEQLNHVYYYNEYATGDTARDSVYMIDVVDNGSIIGDKYNTKKTDETGKTVYRVDYAAVDSQKAFIGWTSKKPSGTPYGPEDVQEEYDIHPSDDTVLRLYPVVTDVYWVSFEKNDWEFVYVGPNKGDWIIEGGEYKHVDPGTGDYEKRGSGAAYIAPVAVLKDQSLAGTEIGPTIPGLGRNAYNRQYYTFQGWYLPNDTYYHGQELTLNTQIKENVTVTAKWKAQSERTYNVVFWKQEASDSVGMADDQKHYRFVGSVQNTVTVREDVPGSDIVTIEESDKHKTGEAWEGFIYNSVNSRSAEQGVSVKPDGSTVLNVYYDRIPYTLTFYDYTYSTTSSTSGNNLYAKVDNRYHLLRNKSGSTFYYRSIEETTKTADDYYYIVTDDGYEATYLYRYNNRWYRTRTYSWGQYRYSDPYDGNVYDLVPYTGQRYERSTPRRVVKTITELYGHKIADQFPITANDGTLYDMGERWDPQGSSTYTEVLVSIDQMPKENITFYIDLGESKTIKTMNYYLEVLPGETGVTYDSKTFKHYTTARARYGFVTRQEDFYNIEGFKQWESNPEFDSDGKALSGGDKDTINFYYTRNNYRLSYYDSYGEAKEIDAGARPSVPFDSPLTGYDYNAVEGSSSITVNGTTVEHEGYVFSGWYLDERCQVKAVFETDDPDTNPVTKMPAGNMNLYAGWKKLRYRVWVQPNGGILTSTESTFFKADWGEKIKKYDMETEGKKKVYEETEETAETDPNNLLYAYIYSADPVNREDFRVSYYKQIKDLGTLTRTVTRDGREVEVSCQEIDLAKKNEDGTIKRYRNINNAYTFKGWYKVSGEISDDTEPSMSQTADVPWNFNTSIEGNTAIRALWQRNGTFHIEYRDRTVIDGVEVIGTLPEYVVDNNVYIDLAQSVAPSACNPPPGYVFVGWEDPLGNLYQPGQVFRIQRDGATKVGDNDFKYIMKPGFRKISSSKIEYNLNGGSYETGKTVAELGSALDSSAGGEQRWSINIPEMTIRGITRNTKVVLSLGRDADGNLPKKPGFVFTGWNSKSDPNYDGARHYDIGGTYAVSEIDNTLYAEWTPVYFDIQFDKFAEEYHVDIHQSTFTKRLNGAVFKLSATNDNTFKDREATSAKIDGTDGIVRFETVTPRSNEVLELTETKAPQTDEVKYKRDSATYTLYGWGEPEEVRTSDPRHIGYTIDTKVVDGKEIKCVQSIGEVAIYDSYDNKVTKIDNEIAFTTVRIVKYDGTSSPRRYLNRARFQVKRGEDLYRRGNNHEEGIYVTGMEGKGDGIAEMNLMPGSGQYEYTIREIKAPAGYKPFKADDYIGISVTNEGIPSITHTFNNDGDIVLSPRLYDPATDEYYYELRIPNDPEPGRKVILRKVGNSDRMPQTQTFKICRTGSTTAVEIAGVKLQELVSDKKGVIWIGTLPYGSYDIYEKSGSNYTKSFSIKVEDDGIENRAVRKN